MSEKDIKKEQENTELEDNTANTEENNGQEQAEETVEETGSETKAEAELAEMKDKYIRLMAEFENFRRRTAKERMDLLKTANEDLMSELLPVLDDMERARQSMEATKDVDAMLQGLELVFHKLKHVTQLKGLKPIVINAGDDFDSDLHEAVTQIPAPSEELKGKIVDVIEKGYTLNEKVIRFAKVIIGA
ncbi:MULTISPECIES: nucleotide exchange factor GrpE [Pontibacter]|uniref:Protein GrpE n=1 Tax=Pontibacter lucknowensis TaxID=1077936 RepID=A0A1N6ZZ16_9BACT|nr:MULTISPECIES: nucleotide exchange factor GrpE [Pontibacter]EJF11292.1 GrpE protein HSP-70 cofactor [Pontibacter sp. BAB1700]SIR32080.1 molecular chaperone GrpE [Pontibacter lucknowensis]